MRGYSVIGILQSLKYHKQAAEALHYAPLILVLEGERTTPCGRGRMVAVCSDTSGSQVVGPLLAVWGTDDSEVAELVLERSHRRTVYVGADKPGRKTRAALDKLKRGGAGVLEPGPAVDRVGRVDCEGSRAGTVDHLVGGEWQAPPPDAKPKKTKAKAKKTAAGDK